MPSRDRNRRAKSTRKLANPRIDALEARQLLSADAAALVPAPSTVVAPTDPDPAPVTASPATSTSVEDKVVSIQNTLTDESAAKDSAASTKETVQATATPTPTPAAATPNGKADLVAQQFSTPGNLDWDQSFVATGTIANVGTGATTAPFQVDLFAAPNLESTADAMRVGSFMVPAGLAAGATHEFELPFVTPGRPNVALTTQPSYYMRLALDTTNTVNELNETNNLSQGLQGTDTAVVTITPRLPSKLVPAGLSVSSGVLDWGATMNVVATVRNEGAGDAPATNARIVLAPFGEDPFGPRGYTIGSVPIPKVSAYQTVSAAQELRLPQYPPTQLSNVGKFVVMMVSDSDAKADPVVKPINYQGPGLDWTTALITPKTAPITTKQLPDLALSTITTPTAGVWDQNIEVRARVENTGKADVGPFEVRFQLTQRDDPQAPALVLGDVTVNGLKAGSSQEIQYTGKLPAQVPSGLDANSTAGRIVARIDPDRAIDEVRIDNNRLTSPPITLRLVGTSTNTPVVTTTGNTPTPTRPTPTPTPTTPTPTAPPQTTTPTTNPPRTIPITTRQRQLQMRRLAAQQKRARQLAAQRARAAHLKIFPRPGQNPAIGRFAKVRILPINPPDQTA